MLRRELPDVRTPEIGVRPARAGRMLEIFGREGGAEVAFDLFFPVLHGTFGEDGTVQGLLEMTETPLVGCSVLGSAAGMDKEIMKQLFRAEGLPVVSSLTLTPADWPARRAELVPKLVDTLGLPLLRQAGPARLQRGHLQGEPGRGAGRRGGRGLRLRLQGAGGKGRRRPGDRVLGHGQRRDPRLPARRDRAQQRVLRLRRQVRRRPLRAAAAGAARAGAGGRGPGPGRAGLPGHRRGGLRPGGLPAGPPRRPGLRQRGQHHPRLHRDQHVPEALEPVRHRPAAAAGRAGRPGPGARRAEAAAEDFLRGQRDDGTPPGRRSPARGEARARPAGAAAGALPYRRPRRGGGAGAGRGRGGHPGRARPRRPDHRPDHLRQRGVGGLAGPGQRQRRGRHGRPAALPHRHRPFPRRLDGKRRWSGSSATWPRPAARWASWWWAATPRSPAP